MRSRLSILLLTLGFTLGGISAAAASSAPDDLSETVLPNGLRVVVLPVHTNPVVCSAVLVRSGVAWEPAELSGASHFLEHLLFNGTESRSQEQLYADVDRIGAYNNATTRADHTLFMLLAPREHLDAAMEIQADMLLRSTLPEEKFDKEKGIVIEEMGASAASPANHADRFFEEELYRGSPYARPVLGSVESIRGLTRDAVLSYYRERYVPQRMVLFLAGDVERETALSLARKYFGDSGVAGTVPDQSMPDLTIPFRSELQLLEQKLEAGRSYLRVGFPAPADDDPDAAGFGLMVTLLAGGGSALERALKGGETPAVHDYSLSHMTTGGSGALVLSAALTGARSATEVLSLATRAMLRDVLERRLDPEDLRRLAEMRRTEDATLEEQIHYYAMFRAPRFLQASADRVRRESDRMEQFGAEAFAALAERYLTPPRAVMTLSGPQQTDGVRRPVELEAFAPADDEAGTTEAPIVRTLDNGLTVSIRTEPGAEVFAAHLVARNRSALEPAQRAGLADLVHRLLLRGSVARDATSLEVELQALGANVKLFDDPRFPFDDYRTSPLYSFAMIESRAERASEVLSLFAEILQTPRFDPTELRRTAVTMGDLAARRAESSREVSLDLFRSLVAPGHALGRPVQGSAGSLKGVDRADVVRMHEKLFAPENLILSIRGGGNPSSVLRSVERIFSGRGSAGGWQLPTGKRMASRRATELSPAPPLTRSPRRSERLLGGQQGYLRMGAVLEVSADEAVALEVANLVLSERLQMELRERQGLAYSIGSGLGSLGGEHRLVSVAIGTSPENLEHAESEIRRVIEGLRSGAVSREEMDRVVAAWIGRILMRRLPRQNQAYYDGLQLLYGGSTAGDLKRLEALRAVSVDQLLQAARRHLDPANWVVAVVR